MQKIILQEKLEIIIKRYIWSIISDSSLSIDKQVEILYKKLSKYNYCFLNERIEPGNISQQFIRNMIYDWIRLGDGQDISEYYKTIISNIADKIIEKTAEYMFNR